MSWPRGGSGEGARSSNEVWAPSGGRLRCMAACGASLGEGPWTMGGSVSAVVGGGCVFVVKTGGKPSRDARP